MVSLYYYAGPRIQETFAAHHASPIVNQYVTDWGEWLYLKWDRCLETFFYRHESALDLSLEYLKTQKMVESKDLRYLEGGVRRWLQVEAEIEKAFLEINDLTGEIGYELGQSQELIKGSWNLPDAQKQPMRAEADGWVQRQLASAARREVVVQRLLQLSSRRLFSALPGHEVGESEGAAQEELP